MIKYILIVICSFPLLVFAQDNWDQQGELEDSQVIIEKNRKIDLPRVIRDFKQVPEIDRPQSAVEVDFNSKQFIPSLSSLSPRVRVLTIKDEKLKKLYANQVKIGGGNYGASYFEGNFASKRDRDKSYGLNLYHHSYANGPIDDRNSGSGYQKISPYGKIIFKKAVLNAKAYYERHNNYLYGYDTTLYSEVSRDSLQRTFNTVGAFLSLSDQNETSPYHYNFSIKPYQFFTNIDNREFSLDYKLNNSFDINDNWAIYLNANGYISSLSFGSSNLLLTASQNRNLLRFKPGVKFGNEALKISLGLNMVQENDTLEGMNQFHVFPDLNVSYTVLNEFGAFVGINGDVIANRYRDLLLENPYLDDVVNVYNTLMPFQFYGGFEGTLLNSIAYETGFKVASVKYNFGYEAILDNAEGEIRYVPKYFNSDNTEANVYAALSTNIEKFRFNLRGDYFYYNVGENQLMPFRPKFQLKMDGSYLIADKIKIGLNAHLQGRMNNVNTVLEENVNYALNIDESIPPIYDLGIKLGYQLSNRSQLFLHANNLIANKYEYYLGYPNRGFQLLGGFTYSF